VAIIARNEEERLPACLASVRPIADEIVVIDTMSSDRTPDLARAAGAIVQRRPFAGFGPTKQLAVEATSGAWVLSIDADERVSPELAEEIRTAIASPQAADGYALRWQGYFLGRRMRFGGFGREWVVKLFRREAGHFTDDRIHEHVEVQGRVGRLRGPLEHHSIRSMREYVEKLERYAALHAEQLAERGASYHWWDALRLPVNFLLFWVLRLGMLDGVQGVLWAGGSAYYSWRKRDLLRRAPAAGAAAGR
jgi:glycosyltransferase involved in cell wall biosynthesis